MRRILPNGRPLVPLRKDGYRVWASVIGRYKLHGITGWVRNCPDYSVEIFAEGDGVTLYEFFDAVQHSHPRAYISNFTVTAAQYRGLESFDVLF